MAQRSNSEWLSALERSPHDPSREEAIGDLRDFLRRGLGSAFGSDPKVSDADLDDFAQEGVLKALERAESFRGQSRFTTWAMTVAVRVTLTHLRRRKAPAASLEEITAPLADEDPTAGIERDETLSALRTAIDEVLTPKQRLAILGKLAGLPVVVIADKLGIKVNALYKLDHDARKKLRVALEAQGFGPEGIAP